MKTTKARLSAALSAMKRQSAAAINLMPIPGYDKKLAKVDLLDTQKIMLEHKQECVIIVRASHIWQKSIPNIVLSELVDTSVCGLADVEDTQI